MVRAKIGTTFMATCTREDAPLTGITVRSSFRNDAGDEFPLIVNITNAAAGEFTLSRTTTDMEPGNYLWDILYVDAGGNVSASPDHQGILVHFSKQVTSNNV